jgi:hypothetical protein
MICDINEKRLSWQSGGNTMSVPLSNVDEAKYSGDHEAVIALISVGRNAREIAVFEVNGELRCRIAEPKQTTFNCLGSNRNNDVAVLATIYQIGWRDWWFSIDSKNAIVESLGEGR